MKNFGGSINCEPVFREHRLLADPQGSATLTVYVMSADAIGSRALVRRYAQGVPDDNDDVRRVEQWEVAKVLNTTAAVRLAVTEADSWFARAAAELAAYGGEG